MAATHKVIILESTGGRIRYALWANVPATRQKFYANPDAKSEWLDATASDVAALKAGEVVEKVEVLARSGLNAAQTRTALEALHADYQAQITAYNPWDRYGSVLQPNDTWVAGGAT